MMNTDRFTPATRRHAVAAVTALTVLVLGAPRPAAAEAAPATALTLAPASRLWLEGDSTLHPYKSSAKTFEVETAFAGGLAGTAEGTRKAVAAGALKSLSVKVPVEGLLSGEGGLDKNLRKALQAEKNPAIQFTLLDYTTEEAKDGSLVVKARGRLSIAGVEKEVVVVANGGFDAKGIHVTGTHALLMSDFGVKPPVIMFGAIKTADKVVIHFDLELEASTPATPAN